MVLIYCKGKHIFPIFLGQNKELGARFLIFKRKIYEAIYEVVKQYMMLRKNLKIYTCLSSA